MNEDTEITNFGEPPDSPRGGGAVLRAARAAEAPRGRASARHRPRGQSRARERPAVERHRRIDARTREPRTVRTSFVMIKIAFGSALVFLAACSPKGSAAPGDATAAAAATAPVPADAVQRDVEIGPGAAPDDQRAIAASSPQRVVAARQPTRSPARRTRSSPTRCTSTSRRKITRTGRATARFAASRRTTSSSRAPIRRATRTASARWKTARCSPLDRSNRNRCLDAVGASAASTRRMLRGRMLRGRRTCAACRAAGLCTKVRARCGTDPRCSRRGSCPRRADRARRR